MDPMVQQAQEQLILLGYDPGTVDGVYGPRTRQALETFQRAQNLPVTGLLDEPTFQALQLAVSPPTISSPLSTPLSRSPLQVVVDYLRFHELQPGRVLPYVTERFLNGTSPQLWIEQTLQERLAQGQSYLSWKVQHLEIVGPVATVQVQSRVRLQGQEHTRYEVFTLLRVPEGDWLIDDWRLEALPVEKPRPRASS
jgi:peptidoglycan hydrolase-like protein with peptidoglycan-binding domain